MKKILLFVCALICSAAMSAKTIYLNTGGGSLWEQAGATFKESISGQAMTAVPDVAVGYYQVELEETQTKVHFYRIGNGSDVWNQTEDLDIPTDKNLFTITSWGGGEWSVFNVEPVDPSTAVYEMKHGWKDGKTWTYKTLNKNEDGTYSLRDIYGGTGCNWKSTFISEKYIANPTLVGEPQKGDSAIFTLTSTEGDGAITITKIDNGDEPIDPIDPDQPKDTVFFVNQSNWEKVYIWGWGGISVNAGWPGGEMTKADYQLKDADVYFFTAPQGATGSCAFNCGSDQCKTGDLTWTAGMYYYDGGWRTRAELEGGEEVATVIALHGDFKVSTWSTLDSFAYNEDKSVATFTVDALDAEKTYNFGMKFNGEWKANGAEITSTNNSTNLGEGSGNMKLITTVAGDYVFTYVVATQVLTVTYPVETAISSVENQVTATKVIRNGQVLIIRDGVAYNMMGQEIK